MAVLPFQNLTTSHDLDYLERGFRDIVAGALATHPRIEMVGAASVERAFRRHRFDPGRPIAPAEAVVIGRELGAARVVCGFIWHAPIGYTVAASLIMPRDPPYVWPLWAPFAGPEEEVDGGLRLVNQILALTVPGSPQLPEAISFVKGKRVRFHLVTTAPSVRIQVLQPLSSPQGAGVPAPIEAAPQGPDVVKLTPLAFRLVQGTDVFEVTAREREGVAMEFAFGSTGTGGGSRLVLDWVALFETLGEKLNLRVEKGGPGTAELSLVNENGLAPRPIKTLTLGPETMAADFVVDPAPMEPDFPVFAPVLPFGPEPESLPLVASP